MAAKLPVMLVAASLFLMPVSIPAARADNAMGYRLLTAEEASALPRNHTALGLDVARAQDITDGGMTFEIMRIRQVRSASPGARAGLRVGDQIIAVDGRVFPSIAAFAAYIGSMTPGAQAAFDVIPANGGPGQAQRVPVTFATSGGQARSGGLSTGSKVAIGVGAAALLGCYELGCFSHRQAAPNGQPQQQLR